MARLVRVAFAGRRGFGQLIPSSDLSPRVRIVLHLDEALLRTAVLLLALVGCTRESSNGGAHRRDVHPAEPARSIASAKATPAPASAHPVRDVPFDGGVARIELERGLEHVLLLGPDGGLVADSWCPAPDAGYDAVRAFFTDVRAAILNGDVAHVSERMTYPLRVSQGVTRLVASRALFLQESARILTPDVIERVRAADPGQVFCTSDGHMLGDGVLWAELQPDSRLGVWAINVGPGPRRKPH